MTTPHALYRIDLDAHKCPTPDCQCRTLTLFADCHPESALSVQYDQACGQIVIGCVTCGRRVTRVAVALCPDAADGSYRV